MENEFGQRLRHVLTDKKMTASELSKLSGVGKSDISNYLNGRYLPKQDKVYMLAKALEVDPGWLMTGIEQSPDASRIPIVVPNSQEFVKITRAMSHDDYVTVMRIFEKTYNKLKEKGEI